jgi:hypothetical protein
LRPTPGLSTRGQHSTPHPDPAEPPRRRANQRQGPGTSAHDRPPLIEAWPSDRGRSPAPATVRHGMHERARDDDGEGRREGHGHTCAGAGAGLRTSLRAFRGVHQRDLHLSVATDEALGKAKPVTPERIRRLGLGASSGHTGDT